MRGVRVVVGGAGLAGLTAAHLLEADGADVTVVEARDRVGGRVHTVRGHFHHGQHAEAGADLIEAEQSEVLALAKKLRLVPAPILKRGWGFYGSAGGRRLRITSAPGVFEEAPRRLTRQIEDYKAVHERWDSPVAQAIGRISVAEWLQGVDADRGFRAAMRGLRGFFLADPEDLSLLAVVDQFASGGTPGEGRMFRLKGGNDRLPRALADRLRGALLLRSAVVRIVQHRAGVRVTVEHASILSEIDADYAILAVPASTAREIEFEPRLTGDQQRALASLRYGAATRVLLQFARRFWRVRRRPSAFGSDQPFGAVWDGNEDQGGRPGILSLLAGGRASQEVRSIVASEGWRGLVDRLRWLGTPAELLEGLTVTWEDDPWSRGGYAIFDAAFDPALRRWLSRPAGRVLFAGEHTSERWQGYMNGAVESGRRVAAEVRALHALSASR
jgi:monoamine oxidase